MLNKKTLIKHLIVDSGAFIRNAKLEDIGENIYTLPDVIREIRDKNTKERLQVLPYDLKFREPSANDVKIVSDFSKKTGDYPTLSPVDLRVLALTYLICKEEIGVADLRKEPVCQQAVVEKSSSLPELTKSIAGFYLPSNKKDSLVQNEDEEFEDLNKLSLTNLNESSGDDESDLDEDEDSWITFGNVKDAKRKMGVIDIKAENTEVACLTTDFAMQNVLIQLGLSVVSLDGYLIRQAKTFILRCFGCFKTTSNMTKEFCPNCGNKTLKRVMVSINEDGIKTLHLNFKRPLNIRGTRYSLPMPKGGKHSKNPILCEDQPIPHNRPSKSAQSTMDIFDPAYTVRSSPFAIKDIYTRAGQLGNRHNSQNVRRSRNPNSSGTNTGNRKNKK